VSAAISREQLRELFLFADLSPDQLDALVEAGYVLAAAADTVLFREGEPATCFYVLLDGELSMTRRVGGGEVSLVRTSQRGVYCGAVAAYAGDRIPQVYTAAVRVTADSRFFVLPARPFAELLREWFPMAMHLLEGMLLGARNAETVVGQRERLLALGQLSAGLMHELNNPAAAASRATAALRERVAGMRHKLGLLASGNVDARTLAQVVDLQEDTVERVAKAPRRSPIEASDLEDEVGDRLADLGVGTPYDLAAVFSAGGLDAAWLDGVARTVDRAGALEPALRWLAYTVETEQLMREIEDATTRIATLLGAMKDYSRMDRAPYEEVDLVEGLESTLAILGPKVRGGITVVRDYAPDLPHVPAHAGELNQVWTNLIDNAVAAMGGEGTLTLRSRVEDGRGGPAERCVVVEVGDTGTGVPAEIAERIFQPFFTTKPVGEGTGLGLDICYRIVVERHRGDLTMRSVPGETWFTVRLPVGEAAPGSS
jgi:signal transduction histidine kinase